MFNQTELVFVVFLNGIKIALIKFRNLLIESFDGGLAVEGFLIVCVSPVRYTGSI